MQSIDSLNSIYTTWIARLVDEFALSEGLRESFAGELQRFFDFMAESLRNANPATLNQILLDWSRSLTQSDFNDRGETLVSICNQLFLSTYKIAEDELSDTDALALIRALLPVQSQVVLFAGELEKQRNIEQITTDLDKVRNEMSRLDKSKSDFISVAAHELKTPLTLIEGYGTMLRELLQSFDANSNIAQILEGMDQGARRLRQIINDMIDVSLIDNDLLTLNFQPVWVGRMINVVKQSTSLQLKIVGKYWRSTNLMAVMNGFLQTQNEFFKPLGIYCPMPSNIHQMEGRLSLVDVSCQDFLKSQSLTRALGLILMISYGFLRNSIGLAIPLAIRVARLNSEEVDLDWVCRSPRELSKPMEVLYG
jgi:signal transduction histidine kinase